MSRRLLFSIAGALAACATMIGVMVADGKAPTNFDTFAKSLAEGVDSRLKGKAPSDATRNIFSAKDHAAKKYTRNPALWCADLAPQLTGCAVWKPPLEYVGERYGGVMITSRHILFCRHAHPSWDGGWMKVQPQIIRFVKEDNSVVDMKLVANVDAPDLDLCVGLLDEDVPAGIHVIPIMPAFTVAQAQRVASLKIPDFSISQAGTRAPNMSNESMAYPSATGDALRAPWKYDVYQGDSGTPRFYVTPAGLALYELTGAANIAGNLPKVKKLIEACDANAVERGVLKKPTGKLPSVAKIAVPGD